MALQRFTATFNAPGFHDSEEIFAEGQAAAEIRAGEIAREPRAGWPYCNLNRITITVKPVVAPVLNSEAAE